MDPSHTNQPAPTHDRAQRTLALLAQEPVPVVWAQPLTPNDVEAMRRRLQGQLRQSPLVPALQHGGRTLRDNSVAQTLQLALRLHGELHRAGFQRLEPRNIRPTHIAVAARLWLYGAIDAAGHQCRKPLGHSSLDTRWMLLRRWLSTLGKLDLAPPLHAVRRVVAVDRQTGPESGAVPDPRPLGVRRTTVPQALGHRARPGPKCVVESLGPDECTALLPILREHPATQLHYWLVRAVTELHLTLQEALLLNPGLAIARTDRGVTTKTYRGRDARFVPFASPDGHHLLRDIATYCRAQSRDQLIWSRERVSSVELAAQRVRALVRRRLQRLPTGPAAAVTPDAFPSQPSTSPTTLNQDLGHEHIHHP